MAHTARAAIKRVDWWGAPGRRTLQRQLNHTLSMLIPKGSRGAWTRCVRQAIHSIFNKTFCAIFPQWHVSRPSVRRLACRAGPGHRAVLFLRATLCLVRYCVCGALFPSWFAHLHVKLYPRAGVPLQNDYLIGEARAKIPCKALTKSLFLFDDFVNRHRK